MQLDRAILLKNISQISLQCWGGAERQTQTAQGAVLSLQRSVDNAVPFAPACVGCSHVFRKRPQGVAQTLSAAEQGEAERLCDGCPCVGAEEICGAPSPYPCRSEGERRLPSQPPSQPSTKELSGASLPHRKKVKRLTYEATPNSARVKKLCFQPAQAHSQGRYRRIHVL